MGAVWDIDNSPPIEGHHKWIKNDHTKWERDGWWLVKGPIFLWGLLYVIHNIIYFICIGQIQHATATSNTELIINSVIILFVITVDEYVYAILERMSHRRVENMSSQVQEQG